MATYYHPPATHNGKTLDTWHFNSDYTKVDAVYVDDEGENAEDVTWDVN